MNYRVIFKDDELYHHGIIGMKWGVRRYQNEDGTLTEAGKKRYDREVAKNETRKAKGKPAYRDEDLKNPNMWVAQDKANRSKAIKIAVKGALAIGAAASTINGIRVFNNIMTSYASTPLSEFVNTPVGSKVLSMVASRYNIPMSTVNQAVAQYGDMTGEQAVKYLQSMGVIQNELPSNF